MMNRFMWQTYIFGVHWRHEGSMYYDELSAASKSEAADYFNSHKRDDVDLVRVVLIGPDENGLRARTGSPLMPLAPLMARPRMDRDADAR